MSEEKVDEEDIPVVNATKVKQRTKYNTEQHNLLFLYENDKKRLQMQESKKQHVVSFTADEKHVRSYKIKKT